MILTVLVMLKVVVAVAGAILLACGAGYGIAVSDARPRLGRYFRAFLLLLLGLVVLTRGAPHNNPAVYWLFENAGGIGLVVGVAALFGGGMLAGVLASRSKVASTLLQCFETEKWLGHGITTFALLAMAAATEQVVRYWNVPAWGDGIFWDRIAHLIARGEMPLGHSYYMPVYQYATAGLYWAFGHHFAVQQVANLIWAPVTVVFLCLTARNLACGSWTVLLVGLLAATHDYLRYTPHLMQIENWYIPVLSMALWAATRCALQPNLRAAVLAGFLIGMTLSVRAQGTFMCAALCTAPLWLGSNPWPVRIRQFVVVVLVFAAVLVPWTMRNWLAEGRLTPMSNQGPTHMVLALEPQAFFGIRRDLVGPEFWESWVRRYSDQAERERAMGRYIVEANLADPLRFIEGAVWRSLAFYGLLPDGVFAKGGPQATDWHATGKAWLLRNLATICLLIASIIGLARARNRCSAFVGISILASMGVVFFVGFTEARIHYPTLPLLFLLPALALAGGVRSPQPSIPEGVRSAIRIVPALVIALALAIVGIWGDRELLQPIREPSLRLSSTVAVDQSVPDMTSTFIDNKLSTGSHSPAGLADGIPLRIRVSLTNHHLPVRWYAQQVRGFPAFSLEPGTPVFFRAAVVDRDLTYDWGTSPIVAVRLGGAQFDRTPVEDDVIELDGRLITRWDSGMAFVDARAGRVIGHSRPARRTLATIRTEEN